MKVDIDALVVRYRVRARDHGPRPQGDDMGVAKEDFQGAFVGGGYGFKE
jgi:hypothetical protein